MRQALLGFLLSVMLQSIVACQSEPTQREAQVDSETSKSLDLLLEGSDSLAHPPMEDFVFPEDLQFEHFGLDRGLSQSSVHAISQDPKGFIWVGTEDGLNRFDGYEFINFFPDPSVPNTLSNSNITDLYIDPEENLWIGTHYGGLNRFDLVTSTFTRYRHDPENLNSLSEDQIFALTGDQNGSIWVGTPEGLNRFDPQSQEWEHFVFNPEDPSSLSSNLVYSLMVDSTNVLWVGTYSGLNRYDAATREFIRYTADPLSDSPLSGEVILAIHEDPSGGIWIGTADGGLNHLDPLTGEVRSFVQDAEDPNSLPSNLVSAIVQDAFGALWVGTDVGLCRYDLDLDLFLHYHHDPSDPESLSDDDVDALMVDRSGGLWVGTAFGALNRYDWRSAQFTHYHSQPENPNSLSENSTWSIHEDAYGSLWIGTNGGGLNRYDWRQDRWTHFRHDPEDPSSLGSDVVMGIYEDERGMLWLGTWGGGLNRFDPRSREFIRYQHDPDEPQSISTDIVWFLYRDRQGEYWVGTAWGLNHFDPKTGQFKRFFHDPEDPTSLSDNNVGMVYEDRNGNLWVGTFDGLDILDRDTGIFTHYYNDPENPQSLGHNTVFSVYEDADGTLWFGTFGGGLNRFDPETEAFTHYRVSDGLPNDVVYGIVADEFGYLWMSTNNGIARFDPRTESFRNFDEGDGLQAREFNFGAYHRTESGEIFFGGVNGFNSFIPEKLVGNQYSPPVVLTSISQGGEPMALEKSFSYLPELNLSWPNTFFDFEFSALSYFHADQNLYAYKLEGFDENWNYVGTKRYGRYTNLPGGTYTLRLIGSNNDRLWNTDGMALRVTVEPPFWATWWFRIVAVVMVVSVGFGYYRLRVRSIEARSRELEEQVEERTRTLAERTRELEAHTREIERQSAELTALYRADEELHRHLTLDEVLQALVDTAVDILQSDKGALIVWDENQEVLRARASHGFDKERLATYSFALGESVVGLVAQTGEPITVDDVEMDDRVTRELVEAEGIRSFMQVPIKIGEEVFGVFSADYARSRAFEKRELRLLISIAGRAALAIQNARLYEDTRDRLEQLTALQETNRAIVSTLELDDLLNLIVQQATDLLKAGGGILNLVDWVNEEDEVVACAGTTTDALVNIRSPLDQSLSGWVSLNNQPVISNQLRADPRVHPSAFTELGHVPLQNAAAVPLAIKDKVIGSLVIVDKVGGEEPFNEGDLDLLSVFANLAATAIENARLYRQAQQLAVVEERQRLARELHDAVTQTLFSASLIAEVLPRIWQKDEQEGQRRLTELQELTRGALAEMRTLLMELRPSSLEEARLSELLNQLAESIASRARVKISVEVDESVQAPAELKVAMYRIAQEALNNVAKHAKAGQVEIGLKRENGTLRLQIKDDGCGFEDADQPADRLGLEIMRERAEATGGEISIESREGRGTQITAQWVTEG
jgi:ligand-binding sensor domain-containing protein/signal transduction histidine kinase